jgi:hypothetical protein
MRLLLILLGLLVILVLLRLFIVKEGFQDNIPLNPTVIQGYDNFLVFYNSFCANWQKAITSSVALELPQQTLTDPSQVKSGSIPHISNEQMNQYITNLSQQLGQTLPPICTTLPTSIDSSSIKHVLKIIPKDVQPYINALNWMNIQLANSHANLGNALQGKSVEGFDDTNNSCKDISKCLKDNPEIINEITLQNVLQDEQKLMEIMIPFVSNSEIINGMETNINLVEKSQEIQNQAQSGELINQINIPGGNSVTSYSMPPGASNLTEMKQNNPDKYNDYKQNYSQWFSIKQLIDQINSTL